MLLSIDITRIVWKLEAASHTEKLVLLCLADHANEKSNCWPSIGTIAKECQLTERAVQKQIRALESKTPPWIVTTKKLGHSSTYRVQLPKGVNPIHPSPPNRVHPSPERHSPPGVNHVHPEPSVEPPVNHQGRIPPSNGKLSAAERITLDKSLERLNKRITELKDADLGSFPEERRELKTERKRILGILGLKA